jgi:hypothetical protein
MTDLGGQIEVYYAYVNRDQQGCCDVFRRAPMVMGINRDVGVTIVRMMKEPAIYWKPETRQKMRQ